MTSDKKDTGNDDASKSNSSSDGESEEENASPPPTLLIWFTRLVSGGLLVLIVGYLVYLSRVDDVAPEFTITPKFDEIVQHESHFALPVDIINGATEAVTNVKVEIVFDGVSRTLTLPLMGQGETASIEVVFETRPTPEALETMVLAYQAP